jgi:outer membrane biosynthesis protein TonB
VTLSTPVVWCRILRFREQALERRYSGGPGESAADAARAKATEQGGTGPPTFGGEIVSRLHTDHGLRACDVSHVMRQDLEQVGLSADECDATLETLANPSPQPPSELVHEALASSEADGNGGATLTPTKSKQAQSAFDRWLAAIHLEAYAPMFDEKGMDDILDVTEVLEADSSEMLESFQLKIFEKARFLRAAATITAADGDDTDQLDRAASVGAVRRTLSGGIGLGRSASAGGDMVSWLGRQRLSHLAGPLVAEGGMHICDLEHVTAEQLQSAGVSDAADVRAFLYATKQADGEPSPAAAAAAAVVVPAVTAAPIEPDPEPEPEAQPQPAPSPAPAPAPAPARAPAPAPATTTPSPVVDSAASIVREAVTPQSQRDGGSGRVDAAGMGTGTAGTLQPATQMPPPQLQQQQQQRASVDAPTSGAAFQEVSEWLRSAGLERYSGKFAEQEMTADSLRGLARAAGAGHGQYADEWKDLKAELQQPPFSMTLGAVLALRERLRSSQYSDE